MNGSRRLSRATVSIVALGLVAAAAWMPHAASALTLTVRVDGTGDVPTIQAAYDSLGGGDTVLVMAGAYPETLRSIDGEGPFGVRIIAPDGPERTSIARIDPEVSSDEPEVEGLSILDTLRLGKYDEHSIWRRCVFVSGVMQKQGGVGTNTFSDCVFRADSHLLRFGGGTLERCTFEQCTLFLANSEGVMLIKDCRFNGPAPLGLELVLSDTYGAHLIRCTFRDLDDGLRATNLVGYCGVIRSVFENVRGRAIDVEPATYFTSYTGHYFADSYLSVGNTRFEGCGTAIWSVNGSKTIEAFADTIRDGRGPAIRAGGFNLWMDDVVVERCEGDGAVLTADRLNYRSDVRVADCTFDRCGGRPIDLDRTDIISGVPDQLLIARNRITNGGLDGVRVVGTGFDVRDNLIASNHGAGLLIERVPGYACTDSIAGNTVVANGGWGIQATVGGAPLEGTCVAAETIEQNLVGWNDAGGMSIHDPAATPRFNDAWMNGVPAYDGFAAGSINLKVDPQLCDPTDGDFHLVADSPCGSSGPFGLIGAFGTGCEASHVAIEVEARGPNPAIRLDDHGQIKIAILGSGWFDARRIDAATVVVGGASARTRGRARAGSLRDVNGDGRTDLLVVADVADLQLQSGDTSIVVRATARDGAHVEGAVRVNVVGRKGASPALAGHDSEPVPIVLEIAAIERVAAGFHVRLSLPAREPALLEAFDVTGRRIASRLLVDSGTGSHDATIPARLERGIYWLRLRQGPDIATKRVVVIE